MVKTVAGWGAVLMFSLSFAGCGTMMHGYQEKVTVDSNPREATAVTNDGQTVTTPGVFVLNRGKDYTVTIEKEGYESQTVTIERSVSPWVYGNVIFAFLGLAIDFYNGSAYTFSPDKVSVTLPPGQAVARRAAPRLAPADIGEIDTAPATRMRQDHAYAVVIGIEQYRQKLPRADFAARDAKTMSIYLTKSLGYSRENVALLLNDKAGKADIEKYFDSWLPSRVQENDSVFVYYSGHGAPNTKNGDAYLVPYDGDPAFVESTAYPLKRLYASLDKLPAKQVVVVLDSCFSGAGGRSVIAKGTRPAMLTVENPLKTTGKTVVLSASKGEQVSATYEKKRHGLLTYFVLKGLKGAADTNGDGAIDVKELFEYVRPEVESIARRDYNNEQTPQLLGSSELLTKGVRLLDYSE